MIDASSRNGVAFAIAATFALIAASYELGPLSVNGWGIIDDHEVLGWVGARDRLPASEFTDALGKTEVLDSTRAARFRPVYYVLRIGEAVLFGKDVRLWYALHWSMYALSVFLLAYGLLRFVAVDAMERVVALTGMVLIIGRAYWMDTFGRLGPAESYAILGASLAMLGFLALLAADRRRRWYLALIAGSLLAAGSKENLLILIVPLTAVAVRDWRANTSGIRVGLVVGAVALIAMGARVAKVVSAAGSDIYGNSALLGARLALVATFLGRPEVVLFGGAGVLLAVVVLARHLWRPGHLTPTGRQMVVLAAMCLGCTAVAATQFVFYAGNLPARSRYDFPYVTLFDGAAVTGGILALRLLDGAVAGWAHRRWLVRAAALLAAGGFVVAGIPGMRTTRADVQWLRTSHRAFEERLARSIDAARSSGATSIVLYARRGLDYEPTMSIARHLSARDVGVPVYLVLAEGAEVLSGTTYERSLLAEMKWWSARGFEGIRPLPPGGPRSCFSFGFDGPADPGCALGTDIWPIRPDEWRAAPEPRSTGR